MPTYAYRCKACLKEFEEIQKFSDKPLARCPSCGKHKLVRLISGSGLVFKGSGFYLTDYKKRSTGEGETGPPPAKEPAEKPKGDSPGETKKESPTDSKSENKPLEKSPPKKKK